MKIIDVAQRSPEWLCWRSGGITASEAAVVVGRSPYKTPWRLWAERTGVAREPDLSANPHVRRGVALEDAARRAFEERHDTLLLPVCAEADEQPILRASFDGIADDGAPVELKAPAAGTFAEVSARKTEAAAFRLYWPQVQHQLFVAGAQQGWLVFYADGEPLLEFPVARDETFLSRELVPACLRFWELIETRKEPMRDPVRDLFVPKGEDLERWTLLAGEYRSLAAEVQRREAALKTLKGDMAGIERALVAMMGEFLAAEAAGLKVSRYLQKGTVDYRAALGQLLPQLDANALEAHRRKSAERVRITPLEEETATVPFDGVAVEEAWQEAAGESFFF